MSPCLESLVSGAGEEEEEEVLIATSPLLPLSFLFLLWAA